MWGYGGFGAFYDGFYSGFMIDPVSVDAIHDDAIHDDAIDDDGSV